MNHERKDFVAKCLWYLAFVMFEVFLVYITWNVTLVGLLSLPPASKIDALLLVVFYRIFLKPIVVVNVENNFVPDDK